MTRRALTLVAGTSAPSPLECIEIEWAKDVVDVRNLPGVRYNDHRSNYLLNFTAVHVPFRAAMKDFLKFKLTTDSWSYNEASNALVYLRGFVTWFAARYPVAFGFRDLASSDIDTYLQHLSLDFAR